MCVKSVRIHIKFFIVANGNYFIKDGYLSVSGWKETSNQLTLDFLKEVNDFGASRLIYTDINQDGMKQGPNFKETSKVADTSNCPVIISGGVSSIDDNKKAKELVNDNILKPVDGNKRIKKDNIGRSIETIEVTNKPSPGENLILTLDKRIQIIAYDVLKKYIQRYQAESGSIVLVEAKSGNILSMANYPSFDPEKSLLTISIAPMLGIINSSINTI